MGALIKYEFRKSWKMKGLVLCFTAFFELLFLLGIWRLNEDLLAASCTGLVLTTICGLFLIGVYGIHILSKDINTKQSYMLFMTPNSSYKILGAKVIENCGSVLVSGVFFIALSILDMMLLVVRYDDVQGLIDLMSVAITGDVGNFNYQGFGMACFDGVMGWVYLICLGYLAVVICATLLKGNRFNGLLSFVAFLVISLVVNHIHDAIYGDLYIYSMTRLISNVGFYALLTLLFYLITAWIMDNKLSV
ncbi:hypothetical protein SAMN05421493_106115 [Pseudobutyrivibrio sp. 49]|uniref:hypothetical protein n=1 Tax=unclassified Pseudobutyrivibrio TaxID=2638619 RepID=UPI000880287B|nr:MULTISPECIES: hypothetical protein [unclassified Pseudobutyrivibrio]SDH99200.1 hypothetical protein SAMN05421493_106115 [Pseudobutyrivibrio sp. 49]SFN88878.1 hypothetical protein SAMN04487831_104229 [Pseudobutyrivibrio sp. UC1225]